MGVAPGLSPGPGNTNKATPFCSPRVGVGLAPLPSSSLRKVRVLGTELHLLTSFGRHDTPLDISKLTLLRIDFGLEQQALGLHVLGQAKAGQVGS